MPFADGCERPAQTHWRIRRSYDYITSEEKDGALYFGEWPFYHRWTAESFTDPKAKENFARQVAVILLRYAGAELPPRNARWKGDLPVQTLVKKAKDKHLDRCTRASIS